MTPAQLATFKAAINADNALAADRAAGRHGVIADYYNAPGAGTVWRPSITVDEMKNAIDWAAFKALTAQTQNTYMAMTQGGGVDATIPSIRAGFVSVFGNNSSSLTALTALAQRTPTRFEALFATNNVTTVYGRVVTVADVVAALGA